MSNFRESSWHNPYESGSSESRPINQPRQVFGFDTNDKSFQDFNSPLNTAIEEAQRWGAQNQSSASTTLHENQPNWTGQPPNVVSNQEQRSGATSEPSQNEYTYRFYNQTLSRGQQPSQFNQSQSVWSAFQENKNQTGHPEEAQNQISPNQPSLEETETQSKFVVYNQPSSESRKSKWATSNQASSSTPTQRKEPEIVQVEEYDYHDLQSTNPQPMRQTPTFDIKMFDDSSQTQEQPSTEGPMYDESIHAVTSFEALNLKEDVLKGIYNMNFNKPSKIQEQALPALLEDPPRNIICQSQSGNGKSAAFVLAMLQRCDPDFKAPQSICLAPTRELARQLSDVVERMAKFTKISCALVIRDASIKDRPITEHIIIGTPGTLLNVLNRRHINTSHIRTFVLDEADNMLEQEGLGEQSTRVKRMIVAKEFQIMLFSATFSFRILEFAKRFAVGARELLLKGEKLVTSNIKQMYMDCESLEHKYEVLCGLYDMLRVSQSIIFCKTRDTAAQISDRMIAQGHRVKYLHAGLTPDERDVVIDEFRKGEFKVLISTNVVSRGIDITQISLVINYDTPLDASGEPDMDVYVHRIGRTGRFGRQGTSICFVHDSQTWQQINTMERILGVTITRVPTDDWEETEKTFKKLLY